MAGSTGDPDADAVLALSVPSAPAAPVASVTGDPDADAVLSLKPVPAASASIAPTWSNAIKGVGESALAAGSGGLKAISSAVNDLLPEAIGGKGSRAAVQKDIDASPALNYKPGPEAQPIINAVSPVTSLLAKGGKFAHDTIADYTSPRTADVVGDVATLGPLAAGDIAAGARGATGAVRNLAAKGRAATEGNPLAGAAEAESSRLADIKTRAESAGFDLPEGGTTDRHADAAMNNRPLVNAAARTELQLPTGAPLTPQMLEKGRQAFGSPGYQAVESLKDAIPLNRKALDAAREDNMNGTPNERLPFPQGDSISGAEAVDFSKKARYLANQLEKNPANPFASQDAQMYRDAAEAVEDSVRDHLTATGREGMADNWDAGRVYYAKSYSVQSALDGAGNVKAADLKGQLFKQGKPLSGGLEDIANLAAQYPEAFKTSRVTAPRVGPIRRAIGTALPVLGAAAGGSMAGGLGAAAGEAAGAHAAGKLLSR